MEGYLNRGLHEADVVGVEVIISGTSVAAYSPQNRHSKRLC
jgi:hypothetical protein